MSPVQALEQQQVDWTVPMDTQVVMSSALQEDIGICSLMWSGQFWNLTQNYDDKMYISIEILYVLFVSSYMGHTGKWAQMTLDLFRNGLKYIDSYLLDYLNYFQEKLRVSCLYFLQK